MLATHRFGTTSFVTRLLIVLVVGLSACGKPPSPATTTAHADERWEPFARQFVEDYFRAQPFFAANAGRHEFDGQMPDVSAAGIAREIVRLHRALDTLDGIDPNHLGERQRFDREYLRHVISSDLFWLEKARAPFTNPAWYVNQLDPDVYLSRDYAPLATRMRAYIAYARTIPTIAADIRANLHAPLPRSYVEFGVDAFGGFAHFYRHDVAPIFAAVNDADLQQQLRHANAAAADAMQALTDWLRSQRATATDDFALGADLFMQMLADTEGVTIPLAHLEAAGRADLERNQAALKQACARFSPKATLTHCIAAMWADKPKGSVVDAARAQLGELRAFIQQHDVVSIPVDGEALVDEAPPYNRANGAYINPPGPYDRNVAPVYYIAPPDPSWTPAERAAYIPPRAVLLFTSVHEVWPGHFLQYLHANRLPNPLEGLWIGYGFAEGWAHYSEEMMYEMGLGRGTSREAAELHIGQLTEALLRDVRLLSAIGLHTRGMTLAESERLFREQAFQDPGTARQQAARGSYDPAYLVYTLGKLIIRKLRDDWMTQQRFDPGDQSHWRAFHDAMLSYGGPPLPLLRRQLLGSAADHDDLL